MKYSDLVNPAFTQEYIACSAVWYDDGKVYPHQDVYGIRTGKVVGCYRHPNSPFPTNTQYKHGYHACEDNTNTKVHQGFITSYGRYVTREEAMEIAIKAKQVDEDRTYSSKQLFSEDIFKKQIN